MGRFIGWLLPSRPTRAGAVDQHYGKKAAVQIDCGIASVAAALGSANDEAPFFWISGFSRSPAVENALAARDVALFSTDIDADKWFRSIEPSQIVEPAMARLNESGQGILGLHAHHHRWMKPRETVQGDKRISCDGHHIAGNFDVMAADVGKFQTALTATGDLLTKRSTIA